MCRSYALPYISEHAGELAGWIPLAPVGIQSWVDSGTLPSEEARSKVNTWQLIIVGTWAHCKCFQCQCCSDEWVAVAGKVKVGRLLQ